MNKNPKQTAFHSISRHGYQTGWEAQLVRLMTGETPDQPFAPTGVRAKIQQWERSTGDKVTLPAPGGNLRYAAADSTGAFLGPEVEVAAINWAAGKTRELQAGMFAEMESGPMINRVKKWEPYKYIECVVRTQYPYAGISFVRDKTKEKPKKEVFEEALNDYFTGEKVLNETASLYDEMLLRQAKASGSGIPAKVQAKMRVRFPNLADLLTFLNVEAIMMKHVRIVLKRVPENGFSWKLHTAYAVNDGIQLRPDAPGKWTGRIKARQDGPVVTINNLAF